MGAEPSGTDLAGLTARLRQLETLLRERFAAAGFEDPLLDGPLLSHETLALLQELGDAIPTPVFCKNREGVFTWCNRALEQLLGFSREDLLSRTLFDVYPIELAAPLHERSERLFADGVAQSETRRLRRSDGSAVQVRIHRALLRDADGRDAGLVGTMLDMSAEQEAMSALRNSEELYRGLYESASDAIFLLEDGRFIDCNPASLVLYGHERHDLIGRSPWEVSPERQPDGRLSSEKSAELIGKALRRGRHHFEWVHRRKDGEDFDAEVSLTPIRRDERLQVLAIVHDITPRKRAEAALKASEELNRGMVQHAPIGVMYVALDGTLVYANPAMERMLGQPEGQSVPLFGRNVSEDPQAREHGIPEILERVRTGEVVRNVETDYGTAHGKRVQLLTHIAPHFNADGQVIGSVFMCQDVSELRRLESQLRHAQKMEAVGTLAGGVAHDFNNLLTGITGNCELALQHLDRPEEARRLLGEVVGISRRAGELTRRLLAFSRRQDLAPRPVLLNRLIDELRRMLRRLIGEQVELLWEPAPNLDLIVADPGQVEQAIINLAVNARDAMPDGGCLTLRTSNRTLDAEEAAALGGILPGPVVALEVADTGVGMDEDLQGRIFEPFFTTKEAGRGTGLGLSMVYAILEQCRGAVGVRSRSGEGSRFELVFPSAGPAPVAEAPRPARSVELLRGSEHVLVVEDEDAVRELTVRLLTHCGYTVTAAADGQQALQAAKRMEKPVDLVLSDVIMPGLSGPALVKRLREMWPDVRVLFCSGYTDGELSRHDLSLSGTVDLLSKPFSLESLTRRVRQAIDGGES